jgi:invasion protein IalB
MFLRVLAVVCGLSYLTALCRPMLMGGRFVATLAPRPLKLRALVRALALLSVSALWYSTDFGRSVAGEVQRKSSIGNWSIYCASSKSKLTIADCSMVSAVTAQNDPEQWIRVGLAYVSQSGDMEMTIRTPHLTYLQKGILISTERGQVGRAFVQRCPNNCETTIGVGSRLLFELGSSDVAIFEYQMNETEGISLSLDLNSFIPAVAELRKVVGLEAEAISAVEGKIAKLMRLLTFGYASRSSETEYVVEMKYNPYLSGFGQVSHVWGQPLDECYGTPAKTEVKVSIDLKVKNDAALNDWLDHTQACASGAVFWISPKRQAAGKLWDRAAYSAQEELGGYALLDLMRERVPNAVVTDAPGGAPHAVFGKPATGN